MNNIYDLLHLLKIKFGSFARSFNIIHKIRFCNTKLDTQKEVSGSRIFIILLYLFYYVCPIMFSCAKHRACSDTAP